MSTNARIGRQNADGTVTSIRCHCDGFLQGVGATLASHYADAEQVEALISRGNLSSLSGRAAVRSAWSGPAEAHPADAWPDSGQDYEYLFDGVIWHARAAGSPQWRPVADALRDGWV